MLTRQIWLVVLLLAANTLAAQTFTATRADDWEALFDRTSGWTGSDGIYSIPLSGTETPGSGRSSPTLFFFGDTFIGEVGEGGERLPGWSLVNNTWAVMPPGSPDPESIRFYWGQARPMSRQRSSSHRLPRRSPPTGTGSATAPSSTASCTPCRCA